jgi:methylenetetrahydrofolate dehydrogenase (NADP+)/methenyltetrahydrofolate cyclohydrolase
LRGQRVVILGRSLIVGRPLAALLTSYDATVTVCHTQTKDLAAITKSADIIIIAIGHAHFLTPAFINPQHPPVIVDVGISYVAPHKIAGDADFAALAPLVKAISPVPGGVGPMTILSLGQNLLQATENALQNA